MACASPLSIANVRHVLLALFAIALMIRMGGLCEAQAATLMPFVAQSACAGMPMEQHKPVKAVSVDCALCAALPGRVAAPEGSALKIGMEPIAALADRLAGLSGGPAPPPPRIV